MDDRERELGDAVDDLADTLETLRAELRDPPRGPLELPRPPRPDELLLFTERYTIPTLISLLEASIRALELLAATIRLAEGRPFDDERSSPERPDRIAAVSRRTLRKLDDALAEVQSAAAGGAPEDPEIRRLLEEARGLRREVDARLADAAASGRDDVDSDPVDVEVRGGDAVDPSGGDETGTGVGVDVDRELESIRRELDGDEDGTPDGDGSDDAGDDRPDGSTESG